MKLNNVHPSWLPIITQALNAMDQAYLEDLEKRADWLPGNNEIFNAFSIPLDKTRYILFGESPYPRKASANGYAFWDAAVSEIWSENGGLSKTVNRATSLRNFIKMLLIGEGLLSPKDTSKEAIKTIKKPRLINQLDDLFQKLLDQGFLLLNASLVLQNCPVTKDAKAWQPFMASLLEQLVPYKDQIELILFGNIAKAINKFPATQQFKQLHTEHPYNVSFVTNCKVIEFFKPFKLLRN